ncbi:hypothetical protein [Actinoplanes sp. GCM10030250]
MSEINPENFAEFTTQDGPEEASVGEDGIPEADGSSASGHGV